MTITARDRSLARDALSIYERILDPSADYRGRGVREARLKILGALIAGTATPNASDESIDAKLDLFEIALADVPAWAVDRAVLRWVRREVPPDVEKNPNYNFTPSPQTIRELARRNLGVAQLLAGECRKVVEAVTFDEAMREPDGLTGAPGGLLRMRSM